MENVESFSVSFARLLVLQLMPPNLEYSLSELGLSMAPVLDALKPWGDANIDRFGKAPVAARAA